MMSFVLLILLISACNKGSTSVQSDDNEFNKQFEDEIKKLRDELGNKEEKLSNVSEDDDAFKPLDDEEDKEEKDDTDEEESVLVVDEEEAEEDAVLVVDEEEAEPEMALEEDVAPIMEREEGVPTLEVMEGEPVNLQITASDPDEDIIVYTFSKPLSSDGSWQTTFGDAGEYVIEITASDGELQTSRKFNLVVHKNNVPPDIEFIDDMTITEGEAIIIDPIIDDKNGDEISIDISEPLGNDGEWETDHTSSGDYTVSITASDGELESVLTFALRVLNKNFPPLLSGLPDTLSIQEGETVVLEPVVEDVDTPSGSETIGLTVYDSPSSRTISSGISRNGFLFLLNTVILIVWTNWVSLFSFFNAIITGMVSWVCF